MSSQVKTTSGLVFKQHNKPAERTQQAVSALDSAAQTPVAYSSDRCAFVRPKGTTWIKRKRAVGRFRLEGQL